MSDALSMIEAESPKKAMRAAQTHVQKRWKLANHSRSNHDGWDFEIWYYENDKFVFYLESVDENPGRQPGNYWRIGIKQHGEDRWRTSGSLGNALGEVTYGLTHSQALARAVKWADANLLARTTQMEDRVGWAGASVNGSELICLG